LPAIYAWRFYAAAGGLVSYTADLPDEYRKTAGYVDCIRGCGRRIGGETANLPIQADLSHARGSRELIVGDVVDLECAGGGVAQHHVALAAAADRPNPATCQSSPTVPSKAAPVI
jgi:hypothetical protein